MGEFFGGGTGKFDVGTGEFVSFLDDKGNPITSGYNPFAPKTSNNNCCRTG